MKKYLLSLATLRVSTALRVIPGRHSLLCLALVIGIVGLGWAPQAVASIISGGVAAFDVNRTVPEVDSLTLQDTGTVSASLTRSTPLSAFDPALGALIRADVTMTPVHSGIAGRILFRISTNPSLSGLTSNQSVTLGVKLNGGDVSLSNTLAETFTVGPSIAQSRARTFPSAFSGSVTSGLASLLGTGSLASTVFLDSSIVQTVTSPTALATIVLPSAPFASLTGNTSLTYIYQTFPTADVGGLYFLLSGDVLSLDASNSSHLDAVATGATLASFAWDLDNDGQFDDAFGSTANLTQAQYSPFFGINPGLFTIGVQVTDNLGLISTQSTTLSLAIPEPATLFLLGSGLAGLAGFNRRRKRR